MSAGRVMRWIGSAGALALAGAIGFVVWLLGTTAGASWLLGRVPGLEAQGVDGRLLGDFGVQRLAVELPGRTPGRLVLEQLAWRGAQFGRAGTEHWLRVRLAELSAARIELTPGQSDAPAAAPTRFALPVELIVDALRVDRFETPALGADPLTGLRARLHLGAENGRQHRIDGLALAWRDMTAEGALQLATAAPFDLQSRIVVIHPRGRAEARLDGTLDSVQADATLVGAASPGRETPSLSARATLHPFKPWPLGALRARTDALDLAAIDPALPTTSISASADVTSSAFDRPAEVRLALRNAEAGRWNDRRIPLRRLDLVLRARPDDPTTLGVEQAEAELGSTQRPAGVVRGSGSWTPARWSFTATLDGVEPAQLDARAPALRVGGPIELAGTGFDSAALAQAHVALRGELDGRFEHAGAAREARLRIDAAADRQGVELRSAELGAGGARAQADGALRFGSGGRPWQAKGKLELAGFDPLPWWPVPADSPWRRGPHRLDATARFDLRLPDAALTRPPPQLLAALRGEATLAVADSRVAGVPIKADASWRAEASEPAAVSLDADVAGNAVRVSGRFDAAGDGSADHWEGRVGAAALERLAPLLRLASAALPAPAGALRADFVADGRWPALRTEGEFKADRVRAGELAIARAEGRWRLAPQADAPLELTLSLGETSYGERSVESATLALQGSAREHRITLEAESKALPPAWVDDAQSLTGGADGGAARPRRSIARLEAAGGIVDAPGAPRSGWRGRIGQLELRGDTGRPWIAARAFDARFGWGVTPSVELGAGSAELLGAALRWSRIAWSGGTAAQLVAQAEIDPIAVAPILKRLQPTFGWGGDLAIGARLDVRSAPTTEAEIVIERRGGDLSVTDETGTTAFGLTDLRLGLVVQDGVWNFTQALAGSTLGVAAGAFVARTAPTVLWPDPDTPVSGVLELRVANLGTWGPWVPPGWRLGGELQVSAGIAGRFGAPEYTGRVRGSDISVRNFSEGVSVRDGVVAITLDGERARVERIAARGGEGEVVLTGEASFGAAPRAELRLVAERFRVLGRIDRQIVASGNARLAIDRATLALDGRMAVDEGLFDFTRRDAPSLGSDVVVVGRPGIGAPAGAAPPASAERDGSALPKPQLDLRVDLGEKLRIRGRGLDTGLRGELRLTSPGGRLAVNGTVRTVDGTYAAYGQKLVIDRGELAFLGPVENPRLNIEATRPDIEIRAGVAVGGTAIAPRVRLFSEPELPEMDKLSWILLGRGSDGLGSTETALLQRAAMALLAGEGEGFTNQFIGAFGLDELSVRQTDGEVRETVVSLGKQLSKRWYIGYERGLNETLGTWQLIYRVARRFTLRAQSGLDNSLDAIWTWRW